ncbi:hypothetical protein EV401DRAFT_1929030 [Pisolithus croceorrhizus]|nr:hypothetical protein EV401DRAFT_1929030 [Pisolithus croceorrhizus]
MAFQLDSVSHFIFFLFLALWPCTDYRSPLPSTVHFLAWYCSLIQLYTPVVHIIGIVPAREAT